MADSSTPEMADSSASEAADSSIPEMEDSAAAETVDSSEFDSWVDGDAGNLPAPSSAPMQVSYRARSLVLVESAFFASTTSLLWLINAYVPPGPLLRFAFPLPIALAYRRWGIRAASMTMLTTLLLLSVLMGPPRSLIFLPYGLMALQLGACWQKRVGWPISIALGSLLGVMGVLFRYVMASFLLGENVLQYLIAQMAEFVDWGLSKLGILSEPGVVLVGGMLLLSITISSVVYLSVIHLIAWALFDRLGSPIPRPPRWVRRIFDRF
ncbi:MAG: DUF2232 domain-containing protein [Cyanobacteria bacterium J06641_5]